MSTNLRGSSYIKAWLGLMLLTALSFGFGSLSLGRFALVIALVIAFVKALIVLFVFMHLAESLFATRMVVFINFFFIALICLGIATDVAFR